MRIDSLIAHGVLRLVERSKWGPKVEALLPAEIRAVRPGRIVSKPLLPIRGNGFEEQDFLKRRALRQHHPQSWVSLKLSNEITLTFGRGPAECGPGSR